MISALTFYSWDLDDLLSIAGFHSSCYSILFHIYIYILIYYFFSWRSQLWFNIKTSKLCWLIYREEAISASSCLKATAVLVHHRLAVSNISLNRQNSAFALVKSPFFLVKSGFWEGNTYGKTPGKTHRSSSWQHQWNSTSTDIPLRACSSIRSKRLSKSRRLPLSGSRPELRLQTRGDSPVETNGKSTRT